MMMMMRCNKAIFVIIHFLSSFFVFSLYTCLYAIFVIHVCRQLKKSCHKIEQCAHIERSGLCPLHCAKNGKLEACDAHAFYIHCYITNSYIFARSKFNRKQTIKWIQNLAWFLQGLEAHSSMFTSQEFPVNPFLQMQLKPIDLVNTGCVVLAVCSNAFVDVSLAVCSIESWRANTVVAPNAIHTETFILARIRCTVINILVTVLPLVSCDEALTVNYNVIVLVIYTSSHNH